MTPSPRAREVLAEAEKAEARRYADWQQRADNSNYFVPSERQIALAAIDAAILAEREAVVKFIRNNSDCFIPEADHVLEMVADQIERGDHQPHTTPGESE